MTINESLGICLISFIRVSSSEYVSKYVIIKLSPKSLLNVKLYFPVKYSSSNIKELLKAKYFVILFS